MNPNVFRHANGDLIEIPTVPRFYNYTWKMRGVHGFIEPTLYWVDGVGLPGYKTRIRFEMAFLEGRGDTLGLLTADVMMGRQPRPGPVGVAHMTVTLEDLQRQFVLWGLRRGGVAELNQRFRVGVGVPL